MNSSTLQIVHSIAWNLGMLEYAGDMQNSYIATKILSLVSNTMYSAQYSAKYMYDMHDIHCTCSNMQSSRKEFELVIRSVIESSMRSSLYLLEANGLVKLTCT